MVGEMELAKMILLLLKSKAMFANVAVLDAVGEIDAHLVSLAQMINRSTTVQLRNAAPLLYSICWQQYFYSNEHRKTTTRFSCFN